MMIGLFLNHHLNPLQRRCVSYPMTRARARPIESEVDSLLYKLDMNMDGTWLLPHHGTLCIIRYEDNPHQGFNEPHQVQEEGREYCTEDGVQ